MPKIVLALLDLRQQRLLEVLPKPTCIGGFASISGTNWGEVLPVAIIQ